MKPMRLEHNWIKISGFVLFECHFYKKDGLKLFVLGKLIFLS